MGWEQAGGAPGRIRGPECVIGGHKSLVDTTGGERSELVGVCVCVFYCTFIRTENMILQKKQLW